MRDVFEQHGVKISMGLARIHAREAYSKGFRKQREGKVIETIKNGRSNRVFDCCGEDFTKLTSWIMPKYCPNCGAKMKGGEQT